MCEHGIGLCRVHPGVNTVHCLPISSRPPPNPVPVRHIDRRIGRSPLGSYRGAFTEMPAFQKTANVIVGVGRRDAAERGEPSNAGPAGTAVFVKMMNQHRADSLGYVLQLGISVKLQHHFALPLAVAELLSPAGFGSFHCGASHALRSTSASALSAAAARSPACELPHRPSSLVSLSKVRGSSSAVVMARRSRFLPRCHHFPRRPSTHCSDPSA